MFTPTPIPAGLERVGLIATDVDHTLFTEAGELPDGIDARLDQLRELGVTFAIASGRQLGTLRQVFPQYADNSVLISDNGGSIAECGSIVYQAELPISEIRELVALTRRFGGIGIILTPKVAYVEARHAEECEEFFHRFYLDIEWVDDLMAVDDVADKYTIYYPNHDAKRALDEQWAPELTGRYELALGDVMWVDVAPKGVSKGSALERLGELCGIDVADMLAFGDTFNDAQMLATVGFGFMMANSSPGMERYGRYVAPSNEDFGVVQVMDEVIAAKRNQLRS